MIGNKTVSFGLNNPCSFRISSPAKAAAEVGSTNKPSFSAIRCCQCRIWFSETFATLPPVLFKIDNIRSSLGGAATAMPAAEVARVDSGDHSLPANAEEIGITELD